MTDTKDTVAAWLEEFKLDRKARGLSPRTVQFYHERLTPYAHSLDGGAPSSAHTRRFLAAERERGLSDWSVHGTARAIKTFLRWCAAEGLIEHAPAVPVPRTPQTEAPPFSPAEVGRLLGVANPRDRALVLFLLDTGLRCAELCSLTGADVDLCALSARVRRGKGGAGRTVFFGAQTRRALEEYFAEAGTPQPARAVWRGETGLALRYEGVRSALQRLGDVAGVHAPPHRFRRTFAVWSLRAGMAQAYLQRLMGHKSGASLKHYLALVDDDLRAAHQAAAPVDRFLT